MRPKPSIVVAIAVVSVAPREARADVESWTWIEHRTRLLTENPRSNRLLLRVFYDLRFTGRHHGLGLAFTRLGPMFEALPWLVVAANYAAFTSSDASTRAPFWEQRVELEATATLRAGPLTLSHRHRGESRWRAVWQRWRYRLQFRASITPPRWRVGAFIWEEALFDLNLINGGGAQPGFLENRSGVGLSFSVAPELRIEIGYALRARQPSPAWELDHIVHTSVAINLAR
jgi:hypothetical protein